LDPDEYIKTTLEAFENEDLTIKNIRDDIIKHEEQEQEIAKVLPEKVFVSFFEVDCKEIRNQLCSKHKDIAQMLKDLISDIAKRKKEEIQKEFNTIVERLSSTPKDIEELCDLRDFMNSIPDEMKI